MTGAALFLTICFAAHSLTILLYTAIHQQYTGIVVRAAFVATLVKALNYLISQMKRTLSFLVLLVSLQLSAQTYPITSITISLPANPDASLTKWGSGTLTITASAKMVGGRIDGRVQESKLLVTIKKSGGKICGSYTSNSAPASNFNAATKVWSGNNALSLLGQDCTLPPGDYEFCVQFFGAGPAGIMALSEEKCKPFTIREGEQQTYQPPQGISPGNGTVFNEANFKKPITFRWTPVIPRPRDGVTYRLKVWQLMEGQNTSQAIIQQPILGNDVGNITQATINNLQSAPCKPPYSCDFIWNVQALDRDGKPIGGNNGTSEAFKITVQPINDPPSILTLISLAKNASIKAGDKPEFSWSHQWPPRGAPSFYKIKIVEVKGDESPKDAMRTNKPFFERDSIERRNFQYPENAAQFEGAKKYAWRIEANRNPPYNEAKNTESEINEFNVVPSVSTQIKLLTPSNKAVVPSGNGLRFTWQPPTPSPSAGSYKIKIVEIKGDESPDNAIRGNKPHFEKDSLRYFKGNKPHFEKDSLRPMSFQYPAYAPKLAAGKRYAWNVQSCEECTDEPILEGKNYRTSETFTFRITSQEGNGRQLRLVAPANGAVLNQGPTFSWTNGSFDTDGDSYYKIKIVEIKGDESTENALRTNKPFFERDSIERMQFQYPSTAARFEDGKKYAWQVSAGDIKSDVSILDKWPPPSVHQFICCKSIDPHDGIKFSWKSNGTSPFDIRIVEIKGHQSPIDAMRSNQPFFERDSIERMTFQYPSNGPVFEKGKRYAWQVSNGGLNSDVSILDKWPPPSVEPVYHSITSDYSSKVVDIKDTLFIQIENNYSSGSNQLSYTIRNLSNNKTTQPIPFDNKDAKGLVRITLPIQNSIIAKGETGMLTVSYSGQYYYLSFRRN